MTPARPRASCEKKRCGLPMPATACTRCPAKLDQRAGIAAAANGQQPVALEQHPEGAARAAARRSAGSPAPLSTTASTCIDALRAVRAADRRAADSRCRSRARHRSPRSQNPAPVARCCRPSSATITLTPASSSSLRGAHPVATHRHRLTRAPAQQQRLIADHVRVAVGRPRAAALRRATAAPP